MLTPLKFAKMALIDKIHLIPPDIRELFIKAILGARRSAVEYVENGTKCPVCSMFGMAGDVRINSTNGWKRACECRRCTATFTAISESACKTVEKQEQNVSKKGKKRKKGRK